MRVMVFGKAVEGPDQAAPPSPEAFAAMDAFIDELVKAGVFVAGAGLQNTNQSKRLILEDARQTVIDGPFEETRDLVAGFQIWEVKDMDEALAWARRSPVIGPGRNEIEIRPFYEAADLSDFVSEDDLATPRGGERGKLGVA